MDKSCLVLTLLCKVNRYHWGCELVMPIGGCRNPRGEGSAGSVYEMVPTISGKTDWEVWAKGSTEGRLLSVQLGQGQGDCH